MKSLKAICTTAILALVLSVPVYAGDVLTPGYTEPPPPPPQLRVESEQPVSTATDSAGDQIIPSLTDIFFLLLAVF